MKRYYYSRPATSFFLLFFLLATSSLQAQMISHEKEASAHGETICLISLLPLQPSQNTSCLEVVSCFNESDSPDNHNNAIPQTREKVCPQDFRQAMASDPNVTAKVSIHKGKDSYSDYISTASSLSSSLWHYGWSAANFGMALLHAYKAGQKILKIQNGDATYKNIYFHLSYMIGAFHHITEMPATVLNFSVSWATHMIIHSGTLILSILERLFDCHCCSQFKNGHNTMILFHVAAIILAALW